MSGPLLLWGRAAAGGSPSVRYTTLDAVRHLVDGLAACVLDVLLPGGLHQVDDLVGNRHVVKFFGHLVTVRIGPLEELQCRLYRFGIVRLLVDDDEAGAGDRPA